MEFVDKYNWLIQCSRANYLSLNKIFCILTVLNQKLKEWIHKKQAKKVN